MKNVTRRQYFISADRPDLTPVESATRQAELIQTLSRLGLQPTPALGKYNGTIEQSVVFSGGIEAESVLTRLLSKYNQDAYLVVHYDYAAELVYNTGERETIGTLTEVNTPGESDFTKVGDRFFVVE